MEIVWLRSAVKDLERLQQFIIQHNPRAAREIAVKVKGAVMHLVAHPELGRPVEDLPYFRDITIPFGAGGYLLRYRLVSEKIYIVSIRHVREDRFH
ncbi:MAG: type II toxin-antitoxin system RelE/ParE family toxin [Gammaproteobacteria bacterium]